MAKKKNYNYFQNISHEPLILAERVCPKCESELGAIKPDRVWCTNEKCNYGELHIIGNGVMGLKFKEKITV